MAAILYIANMAAPWGARQKFKQYDVSDQIWSFWKNLNQNIPNTPDNKK